MQNFWLHKSRHRLNLKLRRFTLLYFLITDASTSVTPTVLPVMNQPLWFLRVLWIWFIHFTQPRHISIWFVLHVFRRTGCNTCALLLSQKFLLETFWRYYFICSCIDCVQNLPAYISRLMSADAALSPFLGDLLHLEPGTGFLLTRFPWRRGGSLAISSIRISSSRLMR